MRSGSAGVDGGGKRQYQRLYRREKAVSEQSATVNPHRTPTAPLLEHPKEEELGGGLYTASGKSCA
jgi:hypothetical protein